MSLLLLLSFIVNVTLYKWTCVFINWLVIGASTKTFDQFKSWKFTAQFTKPRAGTVSGIAYPLTAVPPIHGYVPFQWNKTSRSPEALWIALLVTPPLQAFN